MPRSNYVQVILFWLMILLWAPCKLFSNVLITVSVQVFLLLVFIWYLLRVMNKDVIFYFLFWFDGWQWIWQRVAMSMHVVNFRTTWNWLWAFLTATFMNIFSWNSNRLMESCTLYFVIIGIFQMISLMCIFPFLLSSFSDSYQNVQSCWWRKVFALGCLQHPVAGSDG